MDRKNIIYHRIMRRETFEKAAKDLFNLLKATQTKYPDKPRALYVDIDGHRNKAGGFDADMIEIQTEFGIDFLGKFFTEVHFPLVDLINPNPQCNDIPEGLHIFNANNKKDESLNNLCIENYSNTEFMSEPDVYKYLEKVHDFLLEFKDVTFDHDLRSNDGTRGLLIRGWKNHIIDLITELYTMFLYGNLLSVAAMTRSLIECYVYFSILNKKGNEHLVYEWFLCSLCNSSACRNQEDKLKELMKLYCTNFNMDFEEMWNVYFDERKQRIRFNRNLWLRSLLPEKNLTFGGACNYLEEDYLHDDYESACSFVHGQDIATKLSPFTFYSSVYYRFYIMMTYIFKSIRLFPLDDSLDCQIDELELELHELGEKYCR